MEKFLGKWKSDGPMENFDEYMKTIGKQIKNIKRSFMAHTLSYWFVLKSVSFVQSITKLSLSQYVYSKYIKL